MISIKNLINFREMKYRTGGYSLICTSGKVEFQEGKTWISKGNFTAKNWKILGVHDRIDSNSRWVNFKKKMISSTQRVQIFFWKIPISGKANHLMNRFLVLLVLSSYCQSKFVGHMKYNDLKISYYIRSLKLKYLTGSEH